MKIFYLNLEKDIERRKSMERQFQEIGLSYERINAAYVAGLDDHELAKVYSRNKSMRHYCMDLNPAQIGCAMSHIHAYRVILNRDLPYALVLEDDVILPSDLKDSLDSIEKVIDKTRAEIVLLSPATGDFTTKEQLRYADAMPLVPFSAGFYASSYIVTKPAAQSLLKELFPINDVADCWPRIKRYKVADIFVMGQPLIEQNQDTFGSSTTAAYKGYSGFFEKLIYKARRFRCIILDYFQSPWRRHFHPYNDVLKGKC